jgi:hypothetical protein
MTVPAADAVEIDALLESAAGALVAGVGITAAFVVGLRGVIRASERLRNGNALAAALWATLAVLAIGAACAAVVIGLGIVAQDSPLA